MYNDFFKGVIIISISEGMLNGGILHFCHMGPANSVEKRRFKDVYKQMKKLKNSSFKN